jgi:hypothetical protein
MQRLRQRGGVPQASSSDTSSDGDVPMGRVPRGGRVSTPDTDEVLRRFAPEVMKRASRGRGGVLGERYSRWYKCGFWLLLAGVALTVFCVGFLIAFISFDRVGIPVTVQLIRRMMPRTRTVDPAESQQNSNAAAFASLDDMIAKTYSRMDELHMAGKRWGVQYAFHRPSLEKYGPHQWLWDSGLHMRINAHRDLLDSVSDLYSLLAMQDTSSGFIPEMVYWGDDPNQHGIGRMLFGYSDSKRTDLTQMPNLAFAVEGIYANMIDAVGNMTESPTKSRSRVAALGFLCHVLPRLHKYYMWWLHRRDLDGDGLVSIIHPWESGLDASPLYDDVHRYNRAHRVRRDPDAWTSWGADGREDRPTPAELYPEFIVLLYRYRHRAGWVPSRILDPEAAQTRCPADDASGGTPSVAEPVIHLEKAHTRDVRGRSWSVRDAAEKLRKATESHISSEAWFRGGSIVDGIFDVEDVGVNAVLASSFDTMVRLYDTLLDTLSTTEESQREAFHDRANKNEWCCWARDNDRRWTFSERLSLIRAKRDEAAAAGKLVADALMARMWDADREHFMSFHHVYRRQTSGGVCSDQRELPRDTIQSLFPLLLGDRLSAPMIDSLLAKLRDPKKFGWREGATVPTVSRAETSLYETEDSTLMWRGPSWPTTNWFIARGLASIASPRAKVTDAQRAAAAALHRDLLDQWATMHMRHGFYEYHDAERGSGMGQPGLGMSHAFVDSLLAAASTDESAAQLLPPRLRQTLDSLRKSKRSTVGSLRKGRVLQMALEDQHGGRSALGRRLLDGVHTADERSILDGPRERLYPTRLNFDANRDAYHGQTSHDEHDMTGDHEPLLSERVGLGGGDDDGRDDWRLHPRLIFGCCM